MPKFSANLFGKSKDDFIHKFLNQCIYCAEYIGKDVVTPNIIIYILLAYPLVKSEITLKGGNIWLLNYLLNPYYLKTKNVTKAVFSREASELMNSIKDSNNELEAFKLCLKNDYIQSFFNDCGYINEEDSNTLLSKYSYKIKPGEFRQDELGKYKKIDELLGRKNIMIMGDVGSGRFGFLQNYFNYKKDSFCVYHFNLSSFLHLNEDRLVTIVNGIFQELGDNYIYIPNYLQVYGWIKKLKYNNFVEVLDNLSFDNKLFTKVNKSNFDSKLYLLSSKLNFFSISNPPISSEYLYTRVSCHSKILEKLYGIEISEEDLRNIIKSGICNITLSQPGKSLKSLTQLAIDKYSRYSLENTEKSLLQERMKKSYLQENLNKCIFGQEDAIEIISSEVNKDLIWQDGIISTFLFNGERGCGAFKISQEISKLIFGIDSFRYFDFYNLKNYPYNSKILEDFEEVVKSLSYGVIFLDNVEYVNTSRIDVLNLIKRARKQIGVLDKDSSPLIIIAYSSKPIEEIEEYSYWIENFKNIVKLKKLTIMDLKDIANKEIKKVSFALGKDLDVAFSTLTSEINYEYNAHGVKKLISTIAL